MTKQKLLRYAEITEQIKELSQELELLKLEIKEEFPFGGTSMLEGIQYGTDSRVRIGYDFTRMIREMGATIVSKYETKTPYLCTIVKLTSKML